MVLLGVVAVPVGMGNRVTRIRVSRVLVGESAGMVC